MSQALMQSTIRRASALLAVLGALGTGCRTVPSTPPATAAAVRSANPNVPPPPPPARCLGLLGEYGPDSGIRIVLERDGQVVLHSASG